MKTPAERLLRILATGLLAVLTLTVTPAILIWLAHQRPIERKI